MPGTDPPGFLVGMNRALARFVPKVRSALLVLVFVSIAGATAIACSGSLATSTASPPGGGSSEDETPPEDPDATPPIDAGTRSDASDEGDATLEPTEVGPKDSGARVPRSSVPLVHRASASECTQSRPPGTASSSCQFESCTADDQCEGGASGRCDCVYTCCGGVDAGLNVCTYNQCSTDSDCVGGGPCRRPRPWDFRRLRPCRRFLHRPTDRDRPRLQARRQAGERRECGDHSESEGSVHGVSFASSPSSMGASCLSTMVPSELREASPMLTSPASPPELQAGAREAVVKDEPKAVGIAEASTRCGYRRKGVVAISACVVAGP